MIVPVLVAMAIAAAAQAPAAPMSDAQALSRGWGALAAGRHAEAVALADGILKRRPRSHAAVILKIEAQVAGAQPLGALDTYEGWLRGTGETAEDRGLLEPVAAGMLQELGRTADRRVRSQALQMLARAGDDSAREALGAHSADGDPAATLALASLGDPAAVTNLQALLSAPDRRDKSAAIVALGEQGAAPVELLGTILQDPVPLNRAAAARVLGATRATGATEHLRQLGSDPDPYVRLSATLALAQQGDAQAVNEARALLASAVPDLRLRAAESLAAVLPAETQQAVRPLLQNPDGIIRFRAAAFVGRTDAQAAREVIVAGLTDENPAVQQEAARVLGTTLPRELALLRELLRHQDPVVVATAAGAIVSPPRR